MQNSAHVGAEFNKVSCELGFIQQENSGFTRDSLILAAAIGLSNIFLYLYQLTMGILLTPIEYGVLFSLNSVLAIIMFFSQTVTTCVAKFASKVSVNGTTGNLSYIHTYFLKKFSILGIALFIFFVMISPFFSDFLNIDNVAYVIITFATLLVMLPLAVSQGMLQGLERFVEFSVSRITASFMRLAFGVSLVLIGLTLYGGLSAMFLSCFAAFLPTLFFLKYLRSGNSEPIRIENISSYLGMTIITLFSLTILTNIDAVMAKHFFGELAAGNYSALSLMGRIAFYAPMGVCAVMFPKVARLDENGDGTKQLFIKAILLTLSICSVILVAYRFYADSIITLLFGDKYPLLTQYLFKYSIAMALFSFSFLVANYHLAKGRTIIAYVLPAIALIQTILLIFFHGDVLQFVNVMIVCSSLAVILPVILLKGENTENAVKC
ncbi:oligosaccharide flippase family protein [Chloroflexota bacterium]